MLDFSQHAVIYIVSLVFCAIIAWTCWGTLKALFKSGIVAAVLVLAMGVGVAFLAIQVTEGPKLASKIQKEVKRTDTKLEIPEAGDFGR